jgi:hypothetical protein
MELHILKELDGQVQRPEIEKKGFSEKSPDQLRNCTF